MAKFPTVRTAAQHSRMLFNRLYQRKTWKDGHYGLRWQALMRDQCICQFCGRTDHSSRLHVHHITPHKGDIDLFHSIDNLQTLCEDCHRLHAAQTEYRGYADIINDQGEPLDLTHPFNRPHVMRHGRSHGKDRHHKHSGPTQR